MGGTLSWMDGFGVSGIEVDFFPVDSEPEEYS